MTFKVIITIGKEKFLGLAEDEAVVGEWDQMASFPQQLGIKTDVLCISGNVNYISIAKPIVKAKHPMYKTKYLLMGKENRLSSYLKPIGWRLYKYEKKKSENAN